MAASPPTQEKKAGLSYWAARTLEECDKASEGFAADPVHDLRVAIRRCRSMADGFLSVDPDPAWKQMKRLAKPLFSSLGDLRDTQVMMEWLAKLGAPDDPVTQSLTTELASKEAEQKAAAQDSLAKFDRNEWLSLNDHLAGRTDTIPLDGTVFQAVALERWMDAREFHRHALKNRSGTAYHQLRIGIKRFRYTVENFLPERHKKWSKDLRDLQDALGEVHDFDVLRAMLKTHRTIAPEGRTRWLAKINDERKTRLDLYRSKMVGRHSLWEVWRSELPAGEEQDKAALEKLRTWARFLDPDTSHTELVTGFALQIFDAISQCGISLPGRRPLVEAGAVLHEIGRDKNADDGKGGHRKRGFRLASKLRPPAGWSETDTRYVAAIVRYHRGALPKLDESPLVGLTAKQRSELMPLIGVVRLANAFDEEHEGVVKKIGVEIKDGTLVIEAQGLEAFGSTGERIARARYLLESACLLPIIVRPVPAQTTATPVRPAQTRRRPSVAREKQKA
jgi:CHAD domain-containing protein